MRDALESGKRIMGFGHRVYRAEDPRSRVLKRTAKELGAPNIEIAEELEQVALRALQERHPERVLATNVEYYSARRARRRRDPAAARAGDVRVLPRRRLVGAHPRAEAHRPPVPAVRAVRRPGAAVAPPPRLTLAEAAAQADELAKRGRRARARDAPHAVGRRARGGRARAGLPRARAVAYRAIGQFRFRQKTELLRRGLEDESPACRGSALSRSSCSRATTRASSTACGRCCTTLATRGRQRGRAAARDRLPEERLAAARHDRAARGARPTTTSRRASCARPRRKVAQLLEEVRARRG